MRNPFRWRFRSLPHRGGDERANAELDRLIGAGATLTGVTVGAVVTLGLGPVGGAGAGWLTEQFTRVGAEIAQRHLAPRAETRAGAVYVLALEQVRARIALGEEPDERLRDEVSPGRSAGEELLEALLKMAADTHQERKIPYESNLQAGLVFEPTLSYSTKNQLIAIAGELSWRQLVALALFGDRGEPGEDEIDGLVGEWDGETEEPAELVALRIDLLDLFRRGLVLVPPRYQRVVRPVPVNRGIGGSISIGGSKPEGFRNAFVPEQQPWPALPGEINPAGVWLSVDGRRLAQLMRLGDVPAEDIDELVHALLRADTPTG